MKQMICPPFCKQMGSKILSYLLMIVVYTIQFPVFAIENDIKHHHEKPLTHEHEHETVEQHAHDSVSEDHKKPSSIHQHEEQHTHEHQSNTHKQMSQNVHQRDKDNVHSHGNHEHAEKPHDEGHGEKIGHNHDYEEQFIHRHETGLHKQSEHHLHEKEKNNNHSHVEHKQGFEKHEHELDDKNAFIEHDHGVNKPQIDGNKTEKHEHELHDEKADSAGGQIHEGHREQEGHDEHGLTFSSAELQEFSIKLDKVNSGVIHKTLALTGEVIAAPEKLYHVVPAVSGVVRHVSKHLGDKVKTGDVLALISSRDLADLKADFVAANSVLHLANASLKRERDLFKSKVTAKRKYLVAKQEQIETSVKYKAAKQRLSAIGLTKQELTLILNNKDKDLTSYQLRAPADGIIIEKHAALGEVLETNVRSYTIADLSQVWVNLTVYQKDLSVILQGQQVKISVGFNLSDKQTVMSTISWLSPALDEATRSATARVVLDNSSGNWRPGLFVSAEVTTENSLADIVIPLSALQTLDGQSVVFVQYEENEFEPQVVRLGRRDFQKVEVLQGLKKGNIYVSQNAFVLKAQMKKGSFGHGHSH